jgi:hypothetical protein
MDNTFNTCINRKRVEMMTPHSYNLQTTLFIQSLKNRFSILKFLYDADLAMMHLNH